MYRGERRKFGKTKKCQKACHAAVCVQRVLSLLLVLFSCHFPCGVVGFRSTVSKTVSVRKTIQIRQDKPTSIVWGLGQAKKKREREGLLYLEHVYVGYRKYPGLSFQTSQNCPQTSCPHVIQEGVMVWWWNRMKSGSQGMKWVEWRSFKFLKVSNNEEVMNKNEWGRGMFQGRLSYFSFSGNSIDPDWQVVQWGGVELFSHCCCHYMPLQESLQLSHHHHHNQVGVKMG